MNCPYCSFSDSKVVDSRDVDDGIRRRRECLRCGARFTTYERLQPVSLFVIKKDNRREEYNRNKLLTGVRKACEKRLLPTGALDKLVDDIEAELYQMGKAEIPTSVIGELVMEKLRKLDHVAYIRFASVYRDFADIGDFKKAVDTLEGSQIEPLVPIEQLPLLSSEELEPVAKGRSRSRK